ncbi:patatin-like phospholipase family protein [Lysinibacillus piscis]|uniref:PNPLA domain-containing protein n=1 Tax=Lysinibacillus piscis TaxID=2518931 RepID=A0ABQ5NR30_9BACI|nr:patatin-like phospholipase family protein [Lysinibacillus sp. KH24]GLC90592.1 hypothetical protein LYSBPC_37190 [Lysinibacillus sp. KH24]
MWIDGVFSGGGLKGFALVGAYQVLEAEHFRFKRVAGTSAGAILAAFIAAGYSGKEIEDMLTELDIPSLLDSRKTFLPLPFMKWMNVYNHLGLYKGKELEKWFFKKLAAKGIFTFGDLPKDSLKLVASDLTNGKMIVLPDDLHTYQIDAQNFSVACALRMSCGIPFFFEPVTLKNGKGESVIVDGGVLSNFPLWIFDNKDGRRIRPTIGIKLSRRKEEQCPHNIKNGLDLFEALFSTMKNAHDERYISRQHERDIIFIPVDDYSATQFDLSEEDKEDLLNIGRNRTIQFLKFWPKFRL